MIGCRGSGKDLLGTNRLIGTDAALLRHVATTGYIAAHPTRPFVRRRFGLAADRQYHDVRFSTLGRLFRSGIL